MNCKKYSEFFGLKHPHAWTKKIAALAASFAIVLAFFYPISSISLVSAESWNDDTDENFSGGTHENTENIDNGVRLVLDYTAGIFTSRVFDAGQTVHWDNFSWVENEPIHLEQENDNVGTEPTTLTDNTQQSGTLIGGSLDDLLEADGVYEVFGENIEDNTLNWVHMVENIETGNSTYTILIKGYTSGDNENVGVFIWKNSISDWEPVDNLSTVERTISISIDGAQISDYLDPENMHIKYYENTPDSDQTTVYIDMCIVEENFVQVTDVRFQVRVSEDNVVWTGWLGPSGNTGDNFLTPTARNLENIPDNRYFQYRAIFSSDNVLLTSENGPNFENISIEYFVYSWHDLESWNNTVEARAQWSCVESWSASLDAPIPPLTLVTPTDEENTNDNTPTFAWENSQPADNFHIQIDNDPDFSSPENDVEGLTSSQYTPADLADALYYWRVRMFRVGENSEWSQTRIFRVDVLMPTLVSPANGDNTNDNTTTFLWDNNTVAENWSIWIDDDSDFSSPTLIENTTENTYTISTELSNGTYYWRVQGHAGGTSSVFPEVISFGVDTLMPDLSSLAEDENTNNVSPTFSWENVVAADYWEIWIDEDSDFSTAFVDNAFENTYTSSTSLADDVYYWRVRGYISGSAGTYSSVRSFRVDTSNPEKPILVWPADGENINVNAPNLNWDAPAENALPLVYRVQVSTDSYFDNIVKEANWDATDDNWVVTPVLGDGIYYWRVAARDNAGNSGSFSTIREFRVDTTAPSQVTIYAPENEAFYDGGLEVFFEWTIATDTGAGVENYVIQVDNEQSFTLPPVHENSNIVENNHTHVIFSTGTYYWRVLAVDGAGNNGEWSQVLNFRICLWDSVEDWAATVNALATGGWVEIELWSAGVNGNISWQEVETWSVTFSSPAQLQEIETWSGTVTANPQWRVSESWSTSVNGFTEWVAIESWTLEIRNPNWLVFETWSASIIATIPAPTLVSPVNGDNINDNTPTFTWDNSQPADEFEIQIDDDPNFSFPEIWENSSTNQHAPSWISDNFHYWRVKIWRNSENGPWSENWSFYVDSHPPNPPALIRPLDGENRGDNYPILDWETVDDNSLPVQYCVAVSDDSSFSSVSESSGWISNDAWITSTLSDGLWYWRVQARDNYSNVGENSATWVFRIDKVPPSAPTLTSPETNTWFTDNAVTLSWENVVENSHPVSYEIQVSSDSEFSSLTISVSVMDNSYTLSGLTDGTWYWRVRATDNAGNTGDFENRYFGIDTTPPATPALKSPSEGSTVAEAAVAFSWYGVSDASGLTYALDIIDVLTKTGLTNETYTLSSSESLSDGTYSWRVRATDNLGNAGEWSENYTLTVDTSPPDIQVVSPTESTVPENVEVQVVASDSFGIDNSSINVSLDNDNVDYSLSENKILAELQGLEEGEHNIEVTVKDNAGNENKLSIQMKVLKENVKIEMLSPTAVIEPGENVVHLTLKFKNKTENKLVKTFRVAMADKEQYLTVEIGPESENVASTTISLTGISSDNYQLYVTDVETGETISVGTIVLAATPFPLWILLSVVAFGSMVGSGLFVWKTGKNRWRKVTPAPEPQPDTGFVIPPLSELSEIETTGKRTIFRLGDEPPPVEEFKAFLTVTEKPRRSVDEQWSKLMSKYEDDISPLMMEYKNLLMDMVQPARKSGSELMQGYESLVKSAVKQSKGKGAKRKSKKRSK